MDTSGFRKDFRGIMIYYSVGCKSYAVRGAGRTCVRSDDEGNLLIIYKSSERKISSALTSNAFGD